MEIKELPKDFKNRMRDMLGSEYDDFMNSFSENTSYSGMRINNLKANSQNAIFELLGSLEKVKWCDNGFYADKSLISGKHPYHNAGLVYFQEPSAMSVVSVLPIKENDYVLDLCAAPGGKATAAAEKLNGTGLLVANEIVDKRSKILAENIVRMGISNAIVTNETPTHLAQKFPSFFDKIIVDAPCSGEGMFRKEEKAITEWSVEHTYSCAERQKKILDDAFTMLKQGGYLVYSTCTFAPCENEGIVEYILSKYEDVKLVPIENEELCDANAKWINSDADFSYAKRIFPHKLKGEGHFLALFKKVGDDKSVTKTMPKYIKSKEYRDFEKDFLNINLPERLISFGEKIFLLPDSIDIDKIKVTLAGLFLGCAKKGRFEPSHALALALTKNDFKNTIEVSCEDAKKYFEGQVLACDKNGWTVLLYKGYPIGWGKASGGILKNHYPKHLRY